MFRLLSATIFYLIIIGIYLLFAFFVGQGILVISKWVKVPINSEYAVYWGHGLTLILLAYYSLSRLLQTIKHRRSISKLYPVTNENLHSCQQAMLYYIEEHLKYLADFHDSIDNSDDRPGLKSLSSEILLLQCRFQTIYSKMVNNDQLSEEELQILNELLLHKKVTFVIGKTEVN